MRALVTVREQPNYRRDAFVSGLTSAGFKVDVQDLHRASLPAVGKDDVLVIWNRYGTGEQLAMRFERAGGRVLVAENGYLGADAHGRQHYALALRGHNGSGEWRPGGPERWDRLGLEVKPWRDDGGHVLVLPNRSFGPKGFAMPSDWANDVARRLRARTKREVRIRPHPQNWQQKAEEVREGLQRDLQGAWAAVIWSSSAGLHALLAGIPVFREAPYWVAAEASERDVTAIERPTYPERLNAMQRLAWAQWTTDEIASGEPFRRLLCG